MRFYDVDSGSITLNGHDIRDFDRSALREGFGMVLQDTWLFKGTIMENIRYGRLDATDEEGHCRRQGRQCRPLHPHPCPAATRWS